MERVVTPEHMDDPAIDREELRLSLAYIRGVNRRLGGTAALLRLLKRWSRHWPRDRPVTLLDIGTGSSDIPLAARAWAERAGYDLRITGVDLHPTTIDLAREHVGGRAGIELVQADARRLTDRYKPEAFDYVHAGMFLHHLPFVEVLTVLRIMDGLARAGIVWNDLVRSRVSLAALRILLIGKPEFVRYDATVSVRAGFTKREALDHARRVGIGYARWRRTMWYRFTLAGEKPGAWRP
ncbi:MAG: methyltransferase domain-containing protein [Phycisphaerales bacterium]